MRGRGLKFAYNEIIKDYFKVAPHAGAWIEIHECKGLCTARLVAPHAGAWIEMRYVF